MKTQLFLTFSLLLLLSSCAGIEGLLHRRTFIDQMDHQTDGYFVPGDNFQVVAGDSGQSYRSRRDINKRTPASTHDTEVDEYQRSLRKELAEKEKKLSPKDYRRYIENSDYYPTDSEKIYFLSLSRFEREEYLETKGLRNSSRSYGARRPAALERAPNFESRYNGYVQAMSERSRDLYLGMDKKNVVSSWGRPAKVDVAGDPRHENERWSFYEGGRVKVVYFESGRVQGWAVD